MRRARIRACSDAFGVGSPLAVRVVSRDRLADLFGDPLGAIHRRPTCVTRPRSQSPQADERGQISDCLEWATAAGTEISGFIGRPGFAPHARGASWAPEMGHQIAVAGTSGEGARAVGRRSSRIAPARLECAGSIQNPPFKRRGHRSEASEQGAFALVTVADRKTPHRRCQAARGAMPPAVRSSRCSIACSIPATWSRHDRSKPGSRRSIAASGTALVRVADRFLVEPLAAVDEVHTDSGAHRTVEVPSPAWVPGDDGDAETLLSLRGRGSRDRAAREQVPRSRPAPAHCRVVRELPLGPRAGRRVQAVM